MKKYIFIALFAFATLAIVAPTAQALSPCNYFDNCHIVNGVNNEQLDAFQQFMLYGTPIDREYVAKQTQVRELKALRAKTAVQFLKVQFGIEPQELQQALEVNDFLKALQ